MAERPTSRTNRLDVPREPRGRLRGRPRYDPESFGVIAETIARFLGTARFLVVQTGLVLLWVAWNLTLPQGLRFDEYPFIFLTLTLSLQAAYAAPLILLAQNRQDDRDRVNMEQDRAQTTQGRADMEFLAREIAGLRASLGEVATRDFLRSELQRALESLDGSDDGRERTRDRGARSSARDTTGDDPTPRS